MTLNDHWDLFQKAEPELWDKPGVFQAFSAGIIAGRDQTMEWVGFECRRMTDNLISKQASNNGNIFKPGTC